MVMSAHKNFVLVLVPVVVDSSEILTTLLLNKPLRLEKLSVQGNDIINLNIVSK